MRKSTKRIALLLWVLCASTYISAQQDVKTGWYMMNPAAYNPAAIGENDLLRAFASHRMDFVGGFTNAPMTTYAGFSSPFLLGKSRHAAGVRFMNDKAGLWTNMTVHAQYAYRFKLGKGYLSIGADIGMASVGFHGDSTNLGDLQEGSDGGNYFENDDPVIPKSSVTGMAFDLGAGVYYYSRTWFAGASYTHITQPKITWRANAESGQDIVTTLRGTLYAMGGYNIYLPRHKRWVLRPSACVMTDFSSWDLNLTFLAQYNERWRFGLGYSFLGSVNILLGVDVASGLQLGYTWEIQTSNLMTEGFGSHEIYIAYGFNILNRNKPGGYKSVRHL